MNQLNKLHSTLLSIGKVAEEIAQTAVTILRGVEDEENELVESILDETDSSVSERDVIGEITEYIESMTKDANSVLSDIDDFTTAILKGSLEHLESEFFQNVWFGDMYDCSEIKGLEALLSDLASQKRNLQEDVMVKSISSRLSNNNDL